MDRSLFDEGRLEQRRTTGGTSQIIVTSGMETLAMETLLHKSTMETNPMEVNLPS